VICKLIEEEIDGSRARANIIVLRATGQGILAYC
jgi:hypothetical protein